MTWNEYIIKTKNKPVRPLLQEAFAFTTNKKHALDLGAGALNDVRAIFDNGFSEVTVVDSEPSVRQLIDELSNTLTPSARISFYNQTFETFNFPESKYDLINAQYSLPFIPSDKFNDVWLNIADSITCNGIFVGNFFGTEDGWNTGPRIDMTFHSLEEIKALFPESNWRLIKLEEEKRAGTTAAGNKKYWHVFHIIAERLC